MYSKGSSIHMIFTHVFTLEFAAVIASVFTSTRTQHLADELAHLHLSQFIAFSREVELDDVTDVLASLVASTPERENASNSHPNRGTHLWNHQPWIIHTYNIIYNYIYNYIYIIIYIYIIMSTPVETDMLSSGMSCRKTYVASPSDNPDKSAKVFFESALTLLQDSIWVCLNMGHTSETKRTNSNGGELWCRNYCIFNGTYFLPYGYIYGTFWEIWVFQFHPNSSSAPLKLLIGFRPS